MKILVAIPCYNCSVQIERVLKKLTQHTFPSEVDFLIVENHSLDGTQDTIKACLEKLPPELKSRFIALFHQKNYGLGGSFKSIVEYAYKNNFQQIILFHGDDQASEKDLLNLINEVKENNPDCVLGSRFMPGSILHNYSLIRQLGNQVINLIFSLLLGKRIYEIGSGLNSYKVSSLPLEEVLRYPDHIAFDVNLLLYFMASATKKKTYFMPIEWSEKDQTSNANNMIVAFQVLTMLIKHKLGLKSLLKEKPIRIYQEFNP